VTLARCAAHPCALRCPPLRAAGSCRCAVSIPAVAHASAHEGRVVPWRACAMPAWYSAALRHACVVLDGPAPCLRGTRRGCECYPDAAPPAQRAQRAVRAAMGTRSTIARARARAAHASVACVARAAEEAEKARQRQADEGQARVRLGASRARAIRREWRRRGHGGVRRGGGAEGTAGAGRGRGAGARAAYS